MLFPPSGMSFPLFSPSASFRIQAKYCLLQELFPEPRDRPRGPSQRSPVEALTALCIKLPLECFSQRPWAARSPLALGSCSPFSIRAISQSLGFSHRFNKLMTPKFQFAWTTYLYIELSVPKSLKVTLNMFKAKLSSSPSLLLLLHRFSSPEHQRSLEAVLDSSSPFSCTSTPAQCTTGSIWAVSLRARARWLPPLPPLLPGFPLRSSLLGSRAPSHFSPPGIICIYFLLLPKPIYRVGGLKRQKFIILQLNSAEVHIRHTGLKSRYLQNRVPSWGSAGKPVSWPFPASSPWLVGPFKANFFKASTVASPWPFFVSSLAVLLCLTLPL